MNIQTDLKNIEAYKKYLTVEESINDFLKSKGYMKIELPVLSPALVPESYLEVFETEFKYQERKEKLYLTPSPELFLKRLLAGGIGNCYYLGKSFRNSDPYSKLHFYEFVMLEFYKMNASYMDLADVVFEMFVHINEKIGNDKIDLSSLEKIRIVEAFEKYSGIKEKELFDHDLFRDKAKEKGMRVDGFSFEDLWSQIYALEIEPNLGRNGRLTIIYDYPREFAALAKLNPDGKTSQRFELYINGIELGDCYTELTDPTEQMRRFQKEDAKRIRDGKIVHPIDKGMITALEYGLGDCAGIAIGMERLAMVFSGVDSIDKLKLINIY